LGAVGAGNRGKREHKEPVSFLRETIAIEKTVEMIEARNYLGEESLFAPGNCRIDEGREEN